MSERLLRPSYPVLLVDDEPNYLLSVKALLRSDGLKNVETISQSSQVMSFLQENRIAVLVLDLTMPIPSGSDLLPHISKAFPDIGIIVVTATDEIETAVECMKAGAIDYLVKPVERNRLISSVRRALEISALRNEVSLLKDSLLAGELQHPEAFADIITCNRKMLTMFQYIEVIAGTDQPVLITGETGVGKEMIARLVGSLSGRRGEFVAINIAGLDDTIFSDTLFGHVRGAYTGAQQSREGLVQKAAGGTLFLDEIGDLNEQSQIKLLRLLQDRKYYPLGSDTPRPSNARVVVATNKDIQHLIAGDKFRNDLYFRLRAHQIHIPPLRERRDDIPLLVQFFIEQAAARLNRKKPGIPPELLTLLSVYQFPGNVRELELMIFDAVARNSHGMLSLEQFKEIIARDQLNSSDDQQKKSPVLAQGISNGHSNGQLPTLKEAESYLIEEALKRARGNQGIAATLLGISRQALNKRLNRQER